MFYGKFVEIDGIKLACLFDTNDKLEQYPLPITDDESSVIKQFKSKIELQDYVKKFNHEHKSCVFLVRKNSDFTEGRGPMFAHKLFKKFVDAEKYISEQVGIYGSPQNREVRIGENVNKETYAYIGYNGYDIKLMELE